MATLSEHSEAQISDLFDVEIVQFVIAQHGENDSAAINEEFHNWKDCLHNVGIITNDQCQQFTYVGKYS